MDIFQKFIKNRIDKYLAKYGTDIENLVTRLEVVEFYVYEIYKKVGADNDDPKSNQK